MRKAEGALARLLGLVGRRSYDILGFSARLSPDRSEYEIVLEFAPLYGPGQPGYRPPEVLARLVAKLYDVTAVDLQGEGAPPRGGAQG
jgi:acetolactate synthase regulatory subunit